MILKVVLMVLILVFIGLIFIFNEKISRFFSSYIWTLTIAIPVLLYAVICMWAPAIYDYVNDITQHPNDEWEQSYRVASAFLLQLPNLMCIVFPLCLICDKTKCFAKSLAPFIIVYSFFALLIRFVGFNSIIVNPNTTTWYEYVFVGEPNDRFFFMGNFLMLILPLMIFVSGKTYTKYSVFGGLCLYGIIVSYILIIVNVKQVECCASGLTPGDWREINSHIAQFRPLGNLLPIENYVWEMNVWLLLYMMINLILIFLKNYLTINPCKMTFVYQPWYQNNTFLRSFLAPMDAAINNLINTVMPYGYFFPKQLKRLKLKNFRAYYNGFLADGDIMQYENYMASLEYSLSNDVNKDLDTGRGGLVVRSNKKHDKDKIKDAQEEKLRELEAAIEQQYNEVDYDEAIKKNKKMEKKLRKEAKKNHMEVVDMETTNNEAEAGAM